MSDLHHYTVSTGDVRHSPRSEVSDEVLDCARKLLAPGTRPIDKLRGYTLQVPSVERGWCGTVYHAQPKRPLVTIWIAIDQEESDALWPQVEADYLRITELPVIRSVDFRAPTKPRASFWCASYPILALPAEAFWIADLERCLAWARWVARAT